MPPPPSSAGVPISFISPGKFPLRARKPKNAPILVIAIRLCPHACPIPGRASYSANNAITGPFEFPFIEAVKAVGKSLILLILISYLINKVSIFLIASNSSHLISGLL